MKTPKKNLYLSKPTAFQVMLKPVGATCNLHCTYCYYLEKKKLYHNRDSFVMPEAILESFIRQHIEAHEVPVVQFVFQGGEPCLPGIGYYEKVLSLQKKYAGDKRIENVLQTNGTLLNEEWCRFLKKNNFLVGISIDGPRQLHDIYRKNKADEGTWEQVMKAIGLLRRYGVEFNTLSVVNNVNVHNASEMYNFLKEAGSGYMQFLPVVERIADKLPDEQLQIVHPQYKGNAHLSSWSVDPVDYGNFLITIFNEWVRHDVGKYFVQYFDVALANWVGASPGLCVFSPQCGDASVMEHNGDLYSCDHFVFPENFLGNILDKPLLQMMQSEKHLQFGKDKQDLLPGQCLECDYRFACHGGCPKHRFVTTDDGDPGLNYLCKGYYAFFRHIHPYMQYMADELEKKQPPANVMGWVKKMDIQQALRGKTIPTTTTQKNKKKVSMPTSPRRNDLCPCGSGKKFKHCCAANNVY